jgi:putative addiction module component (TIGR02574 family)
LRLEYGQDLELGLREAMQSIEQLTKEILSLPSVSRALLVEKLVESLEFDTDPTIQAAWVTEAKRRRDEVRNGSVTPIPGEEALAQVRQLLE